MFIDGVAQNTLTKTQICCNDAQYHTNVASIGNTRHHA